MTSYLHVQTINIEVSVYGVCCMLLPFMLPAKAIQFLLSAFLLGKIKIERYKYYNVRIYTL